jgi:hypothetical protein
MDKDGKGTEDASQRDPRSWVNKEGCDSRLRVLGAAGLSSGFASSHFDGFEFVGWEK